MGQLEPVSVQSLVHVYITPWRWIRHGNGVRTGDAQLPTILLLHSAQLLTLFPPCSACFPSTSNLLHRQICSGGHMWVHQCMEDCCGLPAGRPVVLTGRSCFMTVWKPLLQSFNRVSFSQEDSCLLLCPFEGSSWQIRLPDCGMIHILNLTGEVILPGYFLKWYILTWGLFCKGNIWGDRHAKEDLILYLRKKMVWKCILNHFQIICICSRDFSAHFLRCIMKQVRLSQIITVLCDCLRMQIY